jgi:hypothetical protein
LYSRTSMAWCTTFLMTCICCEKNCSRRPCRWSLRLRWTAKAIDPPQLVVVGFFIVGVSGRVDFVRALVRALVLFKMDAARRVAAAVRDRVFRAGALMSTDGRTAARRFDRFRAGTVVIGTDTLGRGCVVGAIDHVIRLFSSSPFVANTLGTGRWLSSTFVVKRLGQSRAACVVRRTICWSCRILGSFSMAVIPLMALAQSEIAAITLSAWLTCGFAMSLCCK